MVGIQKGKREYSFSNDIQPDFSLKKEIIIQLEADLPLIIQGSARRDRIRRRSADFVQEIFFRRKVDRLMELARQAIMDADALGRAFPNGRIWWSRRLTAARGRMKRKWQADPGGIYLCLALFPGLMEKNWQLYNIATGVSVCQIIREWGVGASIRWLNDILIRGRKAGGILAETLCTPGLGERYIIIGIGLNVNQEYFPEHLRSEATSLFLETGCEWPVIDLGRHIISRIAINFAILHEWEAGVLSEDIPPEQPSNVIRAFRALCHVENRRVRFGMDLEKGPGDPGTALGINKDGTLNLLLDDGSRIRINTGEIRYEDEA